MSDENNAHADTMRLHRMAHGRRDGWDCLGDEADLGPRTERRWKSSSGPKTIPSLGIELKI